MKLKKRLVLNKKIKESFLKKGDKVQVIEALNDHSIWTQIESDNLLIEMLKKYYNSMPTSEDEYFKINFYLVRSTKNY